MTIYKLSKSTYGTFLNCKRRFFYNLLGVEKIVDEKSQEIMNYGSDFHKLLNKYNESVIRKTDNEKILNNVKFKNLLKSHLNFDQEVLRKEGFVPIATEQLYETEILKGFIDAVYFNQEKYLIIDYKSVLNIKQDFEKYKMELTFYTLLFSKVKKIDIKLIKSGIEMFKQKSSDFNYFIMETDKNEVEILDEKLKQTNDFIKTHFKETDYEKSYINCNYCEFKEKCQMSK